jgi:flagella basal body P-ring formation protein FlgA
MTMDLHPRWRVVVCVVAAWCTGVVEVSAREVSPQEAIARAATERLGGGVIQVDVTALVTGVTATPGLVAVPDPAGLVGHRARFTLIVDGRRKGVAVATVHVRARVVRALAAVMRGDVVTSDRVVADENEVIGVRFARLPALNEVVGSRAKRDLLPGTVVAGGMIAAPLDVQNGERVTVGVTVGRVHVTGDGVASGSGYIGDVVHVRQAGRRERLKGRITERGVVEVMP